MNFSKLHSSLNLAEKANLEKGPASGIAGAIASAITSAIASAIAGAIAHHRVVRITHGFLEGHLASIGELVQANVCIQSRPVVLDLLGFVLGVGIAALSGLLHHVHLVPVRKAVVPFLSGGVAVREVIEHVGHDDGANGLLDLLVAEASLWVKEAHGAKNTPC